MIQRSHRRACRVRLAHDRSPMGAELQAGCPGSHVSKGGQAEGGEQDTAPQIARASQAPGSFKGIERFGLGLTLLGQQRHQRLVPILSQDLGQGLIFCWVFALMGPLRHGLSPVKTIGFF